MNASHYKSGAERAGCAAGHRIGLNELSTSENAAGGQLLATLQGHIGSVERAGFSPDSQRIVTASRDQTARVYRVITLPELAQLLGY